MLRSLFIFLFFISFQITVRSQTPVKFRKVIGNSGYDYGYSVKQTFDKGYVIGGSTSTFGSGNTDMYIVKTDSMGIPYGQKTIGGINIDQGKCIRQTKDSGYVFLGYTNSFGAGGYDLYLVKMDTAFNIQWFKTYGGSDWDFGSCVEQTSDGGYILCGSTYSFGKGDEDYYLIKTNSTGDTVWTKTYGGIKEDVANSVVQTSDGGYIITGTSKSLGDTLGDIYTIKTNALGDTTWTNKFGGPKLDYGNDILESINGGYIIGGESQSFGTSSDGIILKIATSGATVGLMYQTYLPAFDNIESITEDATGRIGMTGKTVTGGDGSGNGDVFFSMLKYDFSWINATTFGFSNHDIGYSIESTKDHGFIICGYTNSFNNFLGDIYLIKTDTLGFATSVDNIVLTGIEKEEISKNSEFTIYPNPASDNVNISMKSTLTSKPSNIIITDILGKEIKSFDIENNSISINTTDLADGMYYLTIRNKKNSSIQKLVIHH
ncbi:MAG: T9SS type A sorting domain-containing protein [Bacteroidetes bacterium]|nr:T9SS type A sorting domain-containing protein [Bacteroidota bacterium]